MGTVWHDFVAALNPLSWYRFNETQTPIGTSADLGSANKPLNWATAPTPVPSLVSADSDTALSLGATSINAATSSGATSIGTGDFPIFCWIKTTNIIQLASVWFLGVDGTNGVGLSQTNGMTGGGLAAGSTLVANVSGVSVNATGSSFTISSGSVYLVGIVHRSGIMELWVGQPSDGMHLRSSSSASVSVTAPDTNNLIEKWQGIIDELVVLNTALSTTAIGQLYTAGATIPPAAPSITIATSSGQDTITTGAATPGTNPIANYQLYAGTTPGGEGASSVATITSPGAFATQATAAPGGAKFYFVKAWDSASSPGPFPSAPSYEVSSRTAPSGGGTYHQHVSIAPYGITASGQAIGYTVYSYNGAVLIPHTTSGVFEMPGNSGIFAAFLTLDKALGGVIVWDPPIGGAPFVEAFDPQP